MHIAHDYNVQCVSDITFVEMNQHISISSPAHFLDDAVLDMALKLNIFHR